MPKEYKEALEELEQNQFYKTVEGNIVGYEIRQLRNQFDDLLRPYNHLTLDNFVENFDKCFSDLVPYSRLFTYNLREKIKKNPDSVSQCLEELSKAKTFVDEKQIEASQAYAAVKTYIYECNNTIAEITKKLRNITSSYPLYWQRRTAMGNFFKTSFLSGEKTRFLGEDGKFYKAPKHIKLLQDELIDYTKNNFISLKFAMQRFSALPKSSTRSAKTKEFYDFIENTIIPLTLGDRQSLQKFQEVIQSQMVIWP